MPVNVNKFFDNGNFVAGNGGYISIDGIDVNISKWNIHWKNIVVPVTHSGAGGTVVYRTVGRTGYLHVEIPYDFIQRFENVRNFKNGFQFVGYYADKDNMTGRPQGVSCYNILPTDVHLLTSSQADDVVRLVFEGVCNAPVQNI